MSPISETPIRTWTAIPIGRSMSEISTQRQVAAQAIPAKGDIGKSAATSTAHSHKTHLPEQRRRNDQKESAIRRRAHHRPDLSGKRTMGGRRPQDARGMVGLAPRSADHRPLRRQQPVPALQAGLRQMGVENLRLKRIS